MIEKILCQNKHKLYISWEAGVVYEKHCINIATKFTVDSFGIFYLCAECYEDDCKRRIQSDNMTLKKDKGV